MKREWEMFCDLSYYDMWCVREIHDKRFDSPTSFHFSTKVAAEAFFILIKGAQ
jgi:hypothetical protein